MTDQRTRFIFDNQPIRGIHVQLTDVWQHIAQQKPYPKAIRRALGELLAAGAILSSNLKLDGTLIVQVQGQGSLKNAGGGSHLRRHRARHRPLGRNRRHRR